MRYHKKNVLSGKKEGKKIQVDWGLCKKRTFIHKSSTFAYCSYIPLFLIATTIFKALRQASSSVLKVCLCCYALWLCCQPIPLDQSQKADCFRIPITSPGPNPLSSLWHLFLLPVSSSVPLFSSEVDNKDILRALLDVRPLLMLLQCGFFFLYPKVVLLLDSASTIFAHQKIKKMRICYTEW